MIVAEISINPKEFPELVIGDVVEIYHPEEEYRCITGFEIRCLLFRPDF